MRTYGMVDARRRASKLCSPEKRDGEVRQEEELELGSKEKVREEPVEINDEI